MNSIYITLLAIICNLPNAYSFIHVSQPVTSEEYEQLKKEKLNASVTFTWVDPLFQLSFSYKANNTSFTILVDSNLYDQLPKDVKQQFTDIKATKNCLEKDQFAFMYIWGKNAHEKDTELEKLNRPEYYISSPYKSNNQPQVVTIEDVSKLIEKKKVLFYTGAGISAAYVPAMPKLEEMVGFVRNERRPDGVKTIANILSKPGAIACNFTLFVRSTIEAEATPAHKALSSIANYAKTLVLTENIDLLHEATGIKPLFAGSQQVRDVWTPKNCQYIDVLICIGLSHDDRGLIHFYKKHNPQGKVISLDFKRPEYLDSNDMLLQGDLQQNLPLIMDRIGSYVGKTLL